MKPPLFLSFLSCAMFAQGLIAEETTTTTTTTVTKVTHVNRASPRTATQPDDATDTFSEMLDVFGQPHVRLGGAIGFSGGFTFNDHLNVTRHVKTMGTADFGRGGMKLGWGAFAPLLCFTGGLRAAYVRGWNDRDESELPKHIVGMVQARGYLGAEVVVSLFQLGPALEIGAYRAIAEPHENVFAVGYGFGF